MGISENYPPMTAEEYRKGLIDIFSQIRNIRILRYFYIFANEKVRDLKDILSSTESSENGE